MYDAMFGKNGYLDNSELVLSYLQCSLADPLQVHNGNAVVIDYFNKMAE